MPHCPNPIDCVVAVTYRCNARCEMCDIWKITDSPQLTPESFLQLPRTLKDLNLSGGEPFLRADLPEIVANCVRACPRARIVISSNGFATDLILAQMKQILAIKPNIGMAISIDGIADMHDEIRGIPGGFDRALATVRGLKDLGMTNLRLAFTMLPKNVNHLSRVYDLARSMNIELTHSYAQSSDFYFGGKQQIANPRLDLLEKEYDYVIKQELKSWSPKRWLRAYYTYKMKEFALGQLKPAVGLAGREYFFLDPNGNFYPSVVDNFIIGNIADLSKFPSFQEFWRSPAVESKRAEADKNLRSAWMICVARTAIRRAPVRVGLWVIRKKFFPSF